MIRTVVFDLGTVLAPGTDIYTAPAALLGVTPEVIEAHYWEGRRAYDDGGSAETYWHALLERVGAEVTPGIAARLERQDAEAWMPLRPEARELVADCQEQGRHIVVLSNAPMAMVDTIAHAEWRGLVDDVYVSAELGFSKPDPRIYATVQENLLCPPNQVAFIDDRLPNVEGALAFGWQAHLWQSDADSRAWLNSLGNPLIG